MKLKFFFVFLLQLFALGNTYGQGCWPFYQVIYQCDASDAGTASLLLQPGNYVVTIGNNDPVQYPLSVAELVPIGVLNTGMSETVLLEMYDDNFNLECEETIDISYDCEGLYPGGLSPSCDIIPSSIDNPSYHVNADFGFIDKVELLVNGISQGSKTSGYDQGYGNFIGESPWSTNLVPGDNIQLKVKLDGLFVPQSKIIKVILDYNNSQHTEFPFGEPNHERVFEGTFADVDNGDELLIDFQIPSDLNTVLNVTGSRLLRIIMAGANAPSVPTTPFKGTFLFGEVEDYSLQFACPNINTFTESPTITNIDQNWDTDRFIKGIMIIENATLTIDGASVFFADDAEVRVMPNSRLRLINGAVLQSACGGMWEGVKLLGDENAVFPPSSDYLVNNSAEHGIFESIGSCQAPGEQNTVNIVRDAKIGVQDGIDFLRHYERYLAGHSRGIIYVDQTRFINNNIGIYLGNSRFASTSSIKNSRFVSTQQVFPFTGNVHIYSVGHRNKTIISNNKFSALNSPQTGFFPPDPYPKQFHTIGILAINSSLRIGNSEVDRNTFLSLRKGIDTYSTLNATGACVIKKNTFDDVTYGITVNASPFTMINENKFMVTETSDDYSHAYGVHIEKSFGLEIMDNVFESKDPNTKGLVIKDSYFNSSGGGINSSIVRKNTFRGGFNNSTQLQGDNRDLQLNCNSYIYPNVSWFITNNPSVNDANLDEQGVCFPNNADESFSTFWGTPKSADIQLNINTNPFELKINHDAPSQPTIIDDLSGNAVQSIVQCGDDNFQNSCYGTLPTQMPTEEDDDIAGDIRGNIRGGEFGLVVAQLENLNIEWSNKVLVGTYIGQNDSLKAVEKLAMIPQDSEENIAFHEVFTALIEGGSEDVGKQEHGRQILLEYADKRKDYTEAYPQEGDINTTLAETALTFLEGKLYDRSSVTFVPKRPSLTENKIENQSSLFNVMPNPAKNQIQLSIFDKDKLPKSFVVDIYNLQGVLQNRWTLRKEERLSVDISMLNNGLYIVHIPALNSSEKLSIVK